MNEQQREAAGIYLFQTQQALDISWQVLSRLRSRAILPLRELSIKTFDVRENVTAGPIAAAAAAR